MNWLDKICKKLAEKWFALKTLLIQFWYFKNWIQVFSSYRKKNLLPPLFLRGGPVLYHDYTDDAWALFREIFIDRCYSKPGFYTPESCDTVIDCGANIGFFAVYLQFVAHGIKVHCFEPSSLNWIKLKQNIKKNNLDQRVICYPLALLDKDGAVSLKQSSMSGDSSIFNQSITGDREQVRCVSLAQALDICGVEHVDLLKIDVEGAEIEIIEGAGEATWSKIQRVVLEYHEAIRPGCRNRIIDLLKPHFHNIRYWITAPSGKLGIIEASR